MFALSILSVDMAEVSALEYPAVMVVPESIVGSNWTPGTDFTVAIYTNYTFYDIWGYEFTLSYDPKVLHGGKNNTDFWIGDGATTLFNATQTPVVQDSEKVYVNQTLMTKPKNYTINYSKGEIRFTFTATDTWTGDNVTTVFYATIKPVAQDSEKVYVDQTLMTRSYDYTIDYDTGEIEFTREVPGSGVEIRATYIYNAPGDGAEIQATYLYFNVTNGDLIVGLDARFVPSPKGFNNTEGTLALVGAYFYYVDPEWPTTTIGPGTLAYVTFTVVGKGNTSITIGPETKLKGWNPTDEHYNIVDAEIMPDNIGHGYFDNRYQHDVAVGSITAPAGAAVGQLVPINVTVSNVGKANENVEVAVSHDSVPIDTKQVLLLVGESETVLLSWNTSDLEQGTYTIDATATVPQDGDLTDNWNTTKLLLSLHNIAVDSIDAPTKAPVGDVVPINVTVSNIGASLETVNVTISYNTTLISFNDTVELPAQESTVVQFEWNTTDVTQGKYTINANATIAGDLDLNNNWKEVTILLTIHDVAVVDITAPETVSPGDIVPIGVEVVNLGTSPEEANVKIRYATTLIGLNDTVELSPQNSTVVQFEWNTTGLALGPYTINATVTIAVDDDPTDNWKNATVLITMHDVAVTRISAPNVAYIGQLVIIRVLVENLGWYNEIVEVEATYDTSTIGTPKSVNLTTSARAQYVEFKWNTTNVNLGSYNITAEAILPEDENPANNRPETPHTIVVNPSGAFSGTVTHALTDSPIEGATVTVNGHSTTTDADGHYNIANVPPGDYTVSASKPSYQTESTSATAVSGETTTVNIMLTPLPGTIAGMVTSASTGEAIAGANVTANGISATTNSSGAYVIHDLPPGTYTVTASATDYESASETNIVVSSEDTTTVDFTLLVLSSITISADPADITIGDSTTISGSISPTREGVTVTIQYRLEGEQTWNTLTTVTTNENSQYSHTWTPETAEIYEVKASWLGDDITSPAESNVQTITVQEASAIPWYLYVAATGVVAVIIVAAFYFLRIRKPT